MGMLVLEHHVLWATCIHLTRGRVGLDFL